MTLRVSTMKFVVNPFHNIQLMKKSRGGGLVYQPTYIDKRTAERKTAST